jgi:homoserine dehydrogenase
VTRHREFPDRKRVALAGFGVVGQGVYNRLKAEGETFEVVGVLCRDPSRHATSVSAPILTNRFDALPPFDIFVEAIGGVAPARDFVLGALHSGAHVVSANKTLVSRRYDELQAATASKGARLLYSAAVGGGVPMLEAVTEHARRGAISRIDAVVNGTTNFVLDRIGAGLPFAAAISLAQESGFAEADPSTDIDGMDAAEKLVLLARRAFRVGVDPDKIARDRFETLKDAEIVAAQAAGAPFKQIASAWRTPQGGVGLQVRLLQVPAANPLSRPQREENCIIITRADRTRTVLQGKGAGREPTADSVMSDLRALVPTCAPSPR